MKTLYELYRSNAEQDGAVVKTGDTIYWILVRWLASVGAIFYPGDTKNVLLQKLARAKGVTPYPGDTGIKILRRIANANAIDNEWWCLYKLLTNGGITLGDVVLTVDSFVADLGFNTARTNASWTASVGAAGYRVQTSLSSDFSVLASNVDVGNVLTYDFTFSYADVPPEVTVYVRIVAYNGEVTRNSNWGTTHFNVFYLATPAPVLSDVGGGAIAWVGGPEAIPPGYDIIYLESSAVATSGFFPVASDNAATSITDIGQVSVYVRARFGNPSGSYTPWSNIVFAEP